MKGYKQLLGASPLKQELVEGVDLLCVRELTGGVYFGERQEPTNGAADDSKAHDTMAYSGAELRRVVELAYKIAEGRRKKVTSVDKSNVLASSRLWRSVATELAAKNSGTETEHQLVDSCAMRLVTNQERAVRIRPRRSRLPHEISPFAPTLRESHSRLSHHG